MPSPSAIWIHNQFLFSYVITYFLISTIDVILESSIHNQFPFSNVSTYFLISTIDVILESSLF